MHYVIGFRKERERIEVFLRKYSKKKKREFLKYF